MFRSVERRGKEKVNERKKWNDEQFWRGRGESAGTARKRTC